MARVLVTGASGFIAKHIVLQLLQAGHTVIGSLRSPKRQDEVRAAVANHLDGDDWQNRLLFVTLDLGSDDGWDGALKGVDVLMHTASPFPLAQPENEDDLIRPAVDGTLRALKAAKANGIGRVILTSSAVAVMTGDMPAGKTSFDEADWSDLTHPTMTPYGKSKTLAEQAAWDFVQNDAPEINLTTINPVLVLGPPLDDKFGTSIAIVERVLAAKDPAIPRFGLPIVDVRDVATMHVKALEMPEETRAKRFLATNGFLWFIDVAKALKAAYPNHKIITRQAPNWLVRVLAIFDKEIRTMVVPQLGITPQVSNARARTVMGMEFISPKDAVLASADVLLKTVVVK